jgi:type IV pilus assembly protein PilM
VFFSRPNKSVGIDIGSHSVKAVVVAKSGGRLRVEQVGYAQIDRGKMNADPIAAQSEALSEALRNIPLAKSCIVGALPGQSVVIRYPRLAQMPQEKLAKAVESEASQNIPYDLAEVFLDWTLLRTETEGEETFLKVLIVAAKHEVIEARVQIAQETDVQYHILSVDSLALADAAETCGFLPDNETVALINLGANATSIHFMKDGISNFIRDVSWGAREMLQAIAKASRCELPQAEEMLMNWGDPTAQKQAKDAAPEDLPAPPPPPPASTGLGGLGDLGGGGGGLLDPLDGEFGDSGPKGVTKPIGGAAKAGPAKVDIQEVCQVPLNRLVSEIRRSFDFYEQQLYEHPVTRILLSGGIAQFPAIRDILMEELGIEHVEIADPTNSTLSINQGFNVNAMAKHPPQFMVALGLAVRGAAKL